MIWTVKLVYLDVKSRYAQKKDDEYLVKRQIDHLK